MPSRLVIHPPCKGTVDQEGDRPLKLGGRALDISFGSGGKAGETVSHKDLVARVWPTVYVDDTNLRSPAFGRLYGMAYQGRGT